MRKHITDRLALQLNEKVKEVGHDRAYDWFISETKRLSLTDAEQFRVVLLAGGFRDQMVQHMETPPIDTVIAGVHKNPITMGAKPKAKQANHNRSATRARNAQGKPNPSSNCLRDARKACGVAPYNDSGNYLVGDGYFSNDCRKTYGDKMWDLACEMVRGEKK
jgi:hypothetical protein